MVLPGSKAGGSLLKSSSSSPASQFVGRNRHRNQPITINMKGLALLVLGIGIAQAQLKFGGGSSSSSNSGSNSASTSSPSSSDSQDPSTDTRFISTGNELIDGGILGVGAGLLGGAVLGGALNGGNNNFNSNFNSPSNPCGRRWWIIIRNNLVDDKNIVAGNDKLTVMKPTLVCSDCLGATTAVTAAGGGNARLQERMKLVSGSLVWKISWEEEVTVAVTVDTTRAILATAIPVTATPAITTPAITTPATATSSSRVVASATTSWLSEINTAELMEPASLLIRQGGLGATPLEDTRAARTPDNLRDFLTIPGHTRHAPHPSLGNSPYIYSSSFWFKSYNKLYIVFQPYCYLNQVYWNWDNNQKKDNKCSRQG